MREFKLPEVPVEGEIAIQADANLVHCYSKGNWATTHYRVMTLIRGLPGSGKSTVAEMLKKGSRWRTRTFSADDYFHDKDGIYRYDPKKVEEAHLWCQERVATAISYYIPNIIIANTFVELEELNPYIKMALKNDYKLNVIECKTMFGNVHDVPKHKVQKMQQKWEELYPEA